MRKLLLLPLLFLAVSVYAAPNLGGTWKFDPEVSNGQPAAPGASLLVVTQSADAITFDYYPLTKGQRGALLQSYSYTTDGHQHPGYKTRTYVTYQRVYWHKNMLVVSTKGIIDPEGEQTFTDEDHWFVSEDGKTLTHKSSDGKKAVYARQPDPAP